jgi:hypothetical protein
MSSPQHAESLRAKHAAIDLQIQQEENRPKPDDVLIAELKRQKLRIKDEIALLERVPH